MSQTNEFGQPIGESLDLAHPVSPPTAASLSGRFCQLVSLDASAHSSDLYEAYLAPDDDADWTYLPYGPWTSPTDFGAWVAEVQDQPDPMFFAVIDNSSGRATGVASYLRVNPNSRSIEVGHIHFARVLQNTPVATEAMYLMMQNAFELGYRRYEWKCDALNKPSRAAAIRLGFTWEGEFRQATVYKGRNRDTSWFSILDWEWPTIKTACETWLAVENFDSDGQQLTRLQDHR